MPTSASILHFAFFAALGPVLGLGSPASAQSWPPDEPVKIALEPAAATLRENGELAVGVSIWLDGEKPMMIRGASASIGERVDMVRRTKFWGFDLVYDVEEVEVAPGGWTRLTGDDGAIIISGVEEQDLAQPSYLLMFDCGEDGVRTIAVPLVEAALESAVANRP